MTDDPADTFATVVRDGPSLLRRRCLAPVAVLDRGLGERIVEGPCDRAAEGGPVEVRLHRCDPPAEDAR